MGVILFYSESVSQSVYMRQQASLHFYLAAASLLNAAWPREVSSTVNQYPHEAYEEIVAAVDYPARSKNKTLLVDNNTTLRHNTTP